jgi:DNA-binding response OmpR family regulator
MALILIIDDDDLLRGVLAKALTHAGHSVVEAMDGQQGVEVSRVTNLDLVITDLVMPVQEGVETIVTLRKEQPRLPIIAMSGGVANSKLYLDIAGRIGAKRLLPKPFTPAELLAAINDILMPPDMPAGSPATPGPR